MQRFLKWLGTRLFSQPPTVELRDPRPRLRVVPPPAKQVSPVNPPANKNESADMQLVNFETEIGGRIEDAGPGKNVLIRNKYVREDTGTHETLKIIDDSIIDNGEAAGFDPYNTGRFDRSKNWKSHTRK